MLVDLNASLRQPEGFQSVTHLQKNVGNRVCSRLEMIVKGSLLLKRGAELAAEKGVSTVCGATTLAVGVNSLYNGNIGTGMTLTAAGAKELFTTWKAKDKSSDFAQLIDNARASIDMIKILESANQGSFAVVDKNLESIHNGMKKMNERMAAIQSLAGAGCEELEVKKAQAAQSYREANDLFAKAKQCFMKSKEGIQASNQQFNAINEVGFPKLFEVMGDEELDSAEKIEKILNLSKFLHAKSLDAQKIIEESDKVLATGVEFLSQAMAKKEQASEQYIEAIATADNHLRLIQAQAKIEKKYEQQIEETQQKIADIKARNEDKNELIKHLEDNLDQLESQEGWGNVSMIGAALGAVVGHAAGGPVAACLSGAAGAHIAHRRHTIIRRLGDFLFGIKSEVAQPKLSHGEVIKYEFDKHSSGCFRRFFGMKPSQTVGTVAIQIGNEQIFMRFNLNKTDKISRSDLVELQKILQSGLEQKSIDPKACLMALDQLEKIQIVRGEGYSNVLGFTQKNSPFFREIKRMAGQRE